MGRRLAGRPQGLIGQPGGQPGASWPALGVGGPANWSLNWLLPAVSSLLVRKLLEWQELSSPGMEVTSNTSIHATEPGGGSPNADILNDSSKERSLRAGTKKVGHFFPLGKVRYETEVSD